MTTPTLTLQACRSCGCDDDHACAVKTVRDGQIQWIACFWVEDDLCSACQEDEHDHLVH